jgi:hypothetical protein
MTNKNKPRSDLRDAKQWAREIRSTYPCRSHSGNIQMNVVGVVVLASPPRDPFRSKRHNGRRLRALHMYGATTSPPPRSSRVRWSGRWDQQHDSMVHMVESICGQGFAYTRKVEEEKTKHLVKLGLEKATRDTRREPVADLISSCPRSGLICLKRIYNFWCSMLVFTPFAYCFVTLSGTFIQFLELTY